MRRILVTGANKGIGLATVAAILENHGDTFVLLGSRDLERGQAAVESLLQQHPAWSDRIEVLEIDVASDESVMRAKSLVVDTFDAEPTPLYAIVNNAGIGIGTGSGHLMPVLQVNTIGVRRVCEAFLPLIQSAGRIINVTSASGPKFVNGCNAQQQRFFLDANVQWTALETFMIEAAGLNGNSTLYAAQGLGDGNTYGLSKACANLYTLLLARENPKLCINACTPGYIETDLTRPSAESQGKSPSEMGMKSPAEGTTAILFLLFGQVEGSGHYYGSDAKRSPLDRYRAPGTAAYTGP